MKMLYEKNMKKLKFTVEKERIEKEIEKNYVESMMNDGNALKRGN
jgi:hypothetical protein